MTRLSPPLKTSSKIYSGSGNTFCVTLDSPVGFPIIELSLQYGLDGVVFYRDGGMRIFNCDGSEAAMCGNGLRCLIAHLWEIGDRRPLYSIETKGGLYHGSYQDGEVSITFPPPSPIASDVIEGRRYACIDTGVPHAVCEGDLSLLNRLGPGVVAQGKNLTCYQQLGEIFHLATFERGLNRISPACGTGCLAAAWVIGRPEITVVVPSGAELKITLSPPTLRGGVEKKETISILDLS